MKKQLFLSMVTLLVAMPGFSQIKAETKSFSENTVPFQPGNVSQLPYMNYHGFQLQSDLHQPKGFQGVLIPKPQYEKPNWVRTEALQSNMPRVKPSANQKIRVARPDTSVKYH